MIVGSRLRCRRLWLTRRTGCVYVVVAFSCVCLIYHSLRSETSSLPSVPRSQDATREQQPQLLPPSLTPLRNLSSVGSWRSLGSDLHVFSAFYDDRDVKALGAPGQVRVVAVLRSRRKNQLVERLRCPRRSVPDRCSSKSEPLCSVNIV